MKVHIDSLETLGVADGPGIRTVVFLNGCKLRCKFCHNPEMWTLDGQEMDQSELISKILRQKPYFKNNGGVTFSGGEPILQYDFLVDTCKKLKREGVHIAIDTAGIGLGDYSELFKNIDMVLLDVKHITREGYIDITTKDEIDEFFNFVKQLNKTSVEVWIRQVIVPGVNDNLEYIRDLADFIKKHIKNVTKIDFLPYHSMARDKYLSLGIPYSYNEKIDMDRNKCEKLFAEFQKIY